MVTSSERLAILIEANTKSYENAMKRIEQKTNQAIRASSRSVQQLDKSLKVTSATAGVFATRLGLLAGTAGAVAGMKALAKAADEWTAAQNKLAASSELAGRQARSAQALNQIAKETRTSLTATVDLYSKLLRATKDVAQSEEEVARVTEIVNKAFKAGGAAASEQASGILQIAQAFSSGVFSGDELKAVRENAPLVAKAIADEFGVTVGALKELGAAGEIAGDRVFKAILKAGPNIERAFGKTTSTIGDAAQQVSDAFTEMVGELDAMTGASGKAATSMEGLAKAMRDFTDGRFVKGVANVVEAINSIEAAGTRAIEPLLGPTMGGIIERTQQWRDELSGLLKTVDEIRTELALTQLSPNVIQQATLDRFNELNVMLQESNEELHSLAATDMSRLADGLGSVLDELRGFLPALQAMGEAFGLLSRQAGSAATAPVPLIAGQMSTDLIKKFEGYRSNAYWDVNAYRVGYGSDTMTSATGRVSQVTASSTTTVEDAERDLERRIAEFQAGIIGQIGTAFGQLTEPVQAALTSVAYNYGSLPPTVAAAARTANTEAIAASIEGLSANPARRAEEAALARTGQFGLPERHAASVAAAEAHADAVRQAAEAQEEFNQKKRDFEALLLRDGQSIQLESDALRQSTAQAEYAAEKQRLLNELTDAGIPKTAEYAAAIEDLAQRSAALVVAGEQRDLQLEREQEAMQTAIDRADAIRDLGSDVLGGLASDLANGVKPAEALANALQKIAEKLLDIGINALTSSLFGPQGSPLGGILGSLFGGGVAPTVAATVAHSGGVMGSIGTSRSVPASMFAGAPRYHSGGTAGLSPGEMPAILKRGEGVFTPQQMSALGGGNRSLGKMRSLSRQRVDVDNVVRLEPSDMFKAEVRSEVRQGQASTLAAVPGYLADRQKRVRSGG